MKQCGFLCICCDFKGGEFMRAVAELGHRVYLVTGENHRDDAWPREALQEIFFMPGNDGRLWDIDTLKQGAAGLMRHTKIDRIIALDDYDVRKAAYLREEFRMPGMGQTTARHFYDKLAMRIQARDAGIKVPGFTALFHDADINHFLHTSQGPWFIKPRSDAGAHGIRKITSPEQFWEHAESLGNERHRYLLEEYKPGAVYHVDSLSFNDDVLFSRTSQYLDPPFNVAHGGGIFQSHTIDAGSEIDTAIQSVNRHVLAAFGMRHGASHSEYIVSDGQVYFLETSARVGGAHLADMVQAASGINLWREWARVEHALQIGQPYTLPEVTSDHAGIIASLSRQERVDYSQYQEPEIWWTMPKKHHVGFIFRHAERQRILQLLEHYAGIVNRDYHAAVPLND
ncbi:MAG: ATPase [Saprospiraceae bacterium]|nr:ATPase [Saprospiraceae bacterium]